MYKTLIKPVLFKFEPEFVHNLTILSGRFAAFTKLSKLLRPLFIYKNKKLEQNILGIKFENPVGLAGGFDKNAHLINFMSDLGFGFIEVGSITAKPCNGNPKPRLHRLIKNQGIIVNYGLANNGAENISKRLKNKFKIKRPKIPLGINIAKTNDSYIKGNQSIEDYFQTFKIMKNLGDYITINISCPNAGDGRSFEDPKLLEPLLKRVNQIRAERIIFIKISPDLKKNNLNRIISLAKKYKINGFVVSNLTKKRTGLIKEDNLKYNGGISGKHMADKSNKMIRYVYKKTKGKFTIIGCGGIFSGKDAYEKIKNGASLVQLITGIIFEGPGLIKKINKELVELLEKDNYKNIKQAIGKNIK